VLDRDPKRKRGSDGEFEEPTGTATPQGHLDTSAKDDFDSILVTDSSHPTHLSDIAMGIQVGRDTFALTPVTTLVTGTPLVHRPQAVAYVPESASIVEYHRRKKNKTGYETFKAKSTSRSLASKIDTLVNHTIESIHMLTYANLIIKQ
jgi:hypothetical protein